MSIRARALLLTAFLVFLDLGSSSRAGTTSSPVVSYSFQGTLTSVSGLAAESTSLGGLGIAENDIITGTFSYNDTLVGTAGKYTFTGKSDAQTFAFAIYSPSNLSVPVYSDQYELLATTAFVVQVAYSSTTKNSSVTIEGDTDAKYPTYSYANTGAYPFVLTLTDPGSAGITAPSSLLLPKVSGTSPSITNFLSTGATLSWDPSGLSFTADVSDFQMVPQGSSPPDPTLPEPAGLLMAVIGFSTAAAGSLFARRRRADATGRGR